MAERGRRKRRDGPVLTLDMFLLQVPLGEVIHEHIAHIDEDCLMVSLAPRRPDAPAFHALVVSVRVGAIWMTLLRADPDHVQFYVLVDGEGEDEYRELVEPEDLDRLEAGLGSWHFAQLQRVASGVCATQWDDEQWGFYEQTRTPVVVIPGPFVPEAWDGDGDA